MRIGPFLLIAVVLSFTGIVAAQAPVSVVSHSWKADRRPGIKPVSNSATPEKELTGEKYADQKRRANQVQGGAVDHGDETPDARRAELDRISEQSRTPKVQDTDGYTYHAAVKNDSDRTVQVIFWEYRFADIANPANVVRREFLCSASIKPGDKKDLSVFSTLAPSDVVTWQALAKSSEKRFDEKVIINRIEFSDDTVLNRGGWKYDDHKKAIDRATSTPWGKEICRSL